MGGCGCIENYTELATIQGADGWTYSVRLLAACRDCTAPVSVVLARVRGDQYTEMVGDPEVFDVVAEDYADELLPQIGRTAGKETNG